MGRASAVQAVYLGFLFASLLVGIFLVRADFEKRRARLLAHATRRATTASAFYLTGRSHADRGLWGAAIRNWQHAVGKDPTNVQFQRTLGLAYARLGFYDRSLDTLRWARWRAISPSARAEFDEMIAVIEAKADPTNTGSAESNTQ